MSDNKVIDLNSVKHEDMPETTKAALEDAGWIGAALYVAEVGSQVFGGTAVISTMPDPDGWHQRQSGKEEYSEGIFVEVSSLAVHGLAASMVVPFEVEAYSEVRRVFAQLMVQLRTAEQARMSKSTLLVPEKKLVVPKG